MIVVELNVVDGYLDDTAQSNSCTKPVCISTDSRDRRDVTALATQVNKCTAVMWTVNFNITGNRKMMKNGLYLFKFTDFFISLRLFRWENIVFYFDYNSTDFSQIIEKNRVWVGWTAIGLRSFRRERNECH